MPQANPDSVAKAKDADKQPKQRSRVAAFILLLIIFGGIALALFIMSGNDNSGELLIGGEAESTDEIVENALLNENTEEALVLDVTITENVKEDANNEPSQTARASNTSHPTSTVRATNTRRPSRTPSPTDTPSPTNTMRPTSTNTPRPLPTNTPVPVQPTSVSVQPTSVPVQPTSVPVQPTNPPSNNNPVAPIIEPVVPIINTAVPDTGCVLIIGC